MIFVVKSSNSRFKISLRSNIESTPGLPVLCYVLYLLTLVISKPWNFISIYFVRIQVQQKTKTWLVITKAVLNWVFYCMMASLAHSHLLSYGQSLKSLLLWPLKTSRFQTCTFFKHQPYTPHALFYMLE